MKNNKTIHELESIQKSTIYSKYGESLNRLFKSKSLKNLIYKLKNPKTFVFNEIVQKQKKNEIKNKYYMKVHKDIFSTLDLESYNNNKEEEELKLYNKQFKRQKYRYKVYKSHRPPDLMDPFKYNPNYNSISKKIPSVRMALNDKEIKELKKMREQQKLQSNKRKLLIVKQSKKDNGEIKIIPKGNSRNPKSFITSITDNKNQGNNSSKKIELPPIYNTPEQKKRIMTTEINYRNNHVLRFGKYSPRNIKFNKKGLNKLSYLKPYNYLGKKNNAVDFKKMAYRKDKDLIYSSSLSVPTFNIYNPKFDLVEKKAAQICFSPHNENKFKKQYLLRKLWGSYEVGSEYKLINNNKLLDYKDINID